jgi:hypothetical protein
MNSTEKQAILAWINHWRDSNLSKEAIRGLQEILNISPEQAGETITSDETYENVTGHKRLDPMRRNYGV